MNFLMNFPELTPPNSLSNLLPLTLTSTPFSLYEDDHVLWKTSLTLYLTPTLLSEDDLVSFLPFQTPLLGLSNLILTLPILPILCLYSVFSLHFHNVLHSLHPITNFLVLLSLHTMISLHFFLHFFYKLNNMMTLTHAHSCIDYTTGDSHALLDTNLNALIHAHNMVTAHLDASSLPSPSTSPPTSQDAHEPTTLLLSNPDMTTLLTMKMNTSTTQRFYYPQQF